jgi:Thaumarchaeal output domain 1
MTSLNTAKVYGADVYPLSSPASHAREDAIRLLGLPRDLESNLLPDRAVPCLHGVPDAVILCEPNASVLIPKRLSPPLAAIIPVVDATAGSCGTGGLRRADLTVGPTSRSSIQNALAMVDRCVQRVRALPPSVLSTYDPRLWLLARLYVRDRSLEPRRDPSIKETFRYPDEMAIPGAVALAERLFSLGLMERRFFDKLTVCPYCDSARLSPRELCVSCHSRNLVEQPIIHHMRCAYQGPESDFRRQGLDLTCPKCRNRLQQFGVDYDRPGGMYVCADCGCGSGDVSVDFVCLDCEVEIPASHIASRTVYAYSLSPAGIAAVTSGAELPNDSVENSGIGGQVRQFFSRCSETGRLGAVLSIRMREPVSVPAASPQWRETCSFFGTLLHECFTEDVEVVRAPFGYLALLPNEAKADVVRVLPEIRSRLEKPLALRPEIDYAVYAPDELPDLSMQLKLSG